MASAVQCSRGVYSSVRNGFNASASHARHRFSQTGICQTWHKWILSQASLYTTLPSLVCLKLTVLLYVKAFLVPWEKFNSIISPPTFGQTEGFGRHVCARCGLQLGYYLGQDCLAKALHPFITPLAHCTALHFNSTKIDFDDLHCTVVQDIWVRRQLAAMSLLGLGIELDLTLWRKLHRGIASLADQRLNADKGS